ncbi:MAG: VCBS repeat-containing protein [Planctomycetes bacterium]|nr:VCBS repeat-containing protein [Planctomycetota bacterium]
MPIRLTCLLLLTATAAAQHQFREHSTGPIAAVWDAAFCDIDGDGDQDLLQSTQYLVTVKRNDGSGHFTDETIQVAAAGYLTLQTGDFDGDGDIDAFALVPSVRGSVLLRNGGGPITAEVQNLAPVNTSAYASAVADFDDDGDLDIVVAPGQGSPVMLVNDGTGAFAVDPVPFTGISTTFLGAIGTGEWNGDGAPDLLLMQLTTLGILINDGAGSFTWSTGSIPATALAQSMAVADLDDDGISDVIVSTQSSTNAGTAVLRGDGRGGLLSYGGVAVGGFYRLAAADLDDDGDLDVAATSSSRSTTTLNILLNDGAGHLAYATATRANAVPESLARIAAGDVDGDGDVDLFLGGFPLPVAFPQLLFVNHHRQVAITNRPRVGTAIALELNHRPGYGTGLGVGLSAAAFAAPAPLPTPYGRVWLDPATAVNLPFVSFFGANGTAQLNVALPNDRNLANVEVLVQALPLDLFPISTAPRLTGFDRVVIAP